MYFAPVRRPNPDLPGFYSKARRFAKLLAGGFSLLLSGLLIGCESAGAKPLRQSESRAPSSDVGKVAAWRDAEYITAQGSQRVAVAGSGESMAPVFGENTMLVIQQVPFEDLAAGMIVAYRNHRGLAVVHRLVEQTRRGDWRVQGLNNATLDWETVTRDNLLGVVYASLAHEAGPPTFGPPPAGRP